MTRLALLILFFAGGSAALIYELVWFYLIELVVGASSLSIAVLLSIFMGGMALGSALLPRIVSASYHPLRVVAMLEGSIGAIGLAIPFVLPYVQQAYVAMAGAGYSGVLARAAVCTLVLLPPTMLMGATLPAISRWTRATAEGASTVGLIYMANIAGGACGAVLAGFYLLRVYDTLVASSVAAAINLTAAAFALWLAARLDYTPAHAVRSDGSSDPSGPVTVYAVAALSGLTALGAQVVWTRQLSLLFGASVYTFSLILTVFLVGLGLGSLAGSAFARRVEPARSLGLAQLLLVLSIGWAAWAIVGLLPLWQPTATYLPWVRASPALTFGFDAFRCAVALLPATLCWGASFPLALAAATGGADAGRPVARISAVNTVGALLGALGFSLLGIPYLGSHYAQQLLVAFAAVGAGLMLLRGATILLPTAIVAVTAVAAMAIVPQVPGRLIAYGRSVNSWDSIERFLYLTEGATASIAVTESVGGSRQFHIAGKVEASDLDVDMRLERMLGHVPALMHPDPRSVLIVGVGAGVTAGALAIHPEVERIVICEIEPAVPASARMHFGNENHHVLDDPRVQLVFDDARHFLQTTTETFDIITSDPIHPWVRGAATLYSLEYLQLVRAHLNPGGVVTQWIPLYETDVRSVKSELATFAQVFPDTTLWNPDLLEEGYDLVALGRLDGGPIDEGAIDRRLAANAAVKESMEGVALPTGSALMSTYAGRASDLAPWLADAEINRERHLRLQYFAGLAANIDQRYRIFQELVALRRYPADLFVASAELEAQLRRWYVP